VSCRARSVAFRRPSSIANVCQYWHVCQILEPTNSTAGPESGRAPQWRLTRSAVGRRTPLSFVLPTAAMPRWRSLTQRRSTGAFGQLRSLNEVADSGHRTLQFDRRREGRENMTSVNVSRSRKEYKTLDPRRASRRWCPGSLTRRVQKPVSSGATARRERLLAAGASWGAPA